MPTQWRDRTTVLVCHVKQRMINFVQQYQIASCTLQYNYSLIQMNEINGKKIVLSFTAEKNCLLLILSGKKCTFKL